MAMEACIVAPSISLESSNQSCCGQIGALLGRLGTVGEAHFRSLKQSGELFPSTMNVRRRPREGSTRIRPILKKRETCCRKPKKSPRLRVRAHRHEEPMMMSEVLLKIKSQADICCIYFVVVTYCTVHIYHAELDNRTCGSDKNSLRMCDAFKKPSQGCVVNRPCIARAPWTIWSKK